LSNLRFVPFALKNYMEKRLMYLLFLNEQAHFVGSESCGWVS